MASKSFPKQFKSYVPFLLYMLILAALMPRAERFDRDYSRGYPWKYETFVADFDFPIYKTEEQISEELFAAESRVVPYFKYSENAVTAALNAADNLSFGEADTMRMEIISEIRRIYAHGIVSEDPATLGKGRGDVSGGMIYIQKDKRARKYPASEAYTASDARTALLNAVLASCPGSQVDSVLTFSGVYDILKPNLIYDKQTTEMVHSDASREVSPTQGFVSAGTVVVREGEIVTADILQMLDSYKREYESNHGSDKPLYLSLGINLLIALVLTMILFLVIFFAGRGLMSVPKQLHFVCFVSILAAVPVLLLANSDKLELVYLIPFPLVAIYLQAFFKNRIVAPVYAASMLPMALVLQQGPALYVMFLLAGLVAIKSFGVFNHGWKQFLTAFIVFAFLMLGFIVFKTAGYLKASTTMAAVYLLIGSILSVVAYQLVFLFEKVFGLLSVARLDELADTGGKLLRELELKAPGTFQHSLQVMRMSEAAARSIDADVALVRAGAMYHDIGKMRNPRCFVENESLLVGPDAPKYHSELTPVQSAHDITRHVTDGLEIADKERLPGLVKDFIATHHGTSLVKYFYNQHLNAGGDPADASQFRYQGAKPSRKEHVILMLSDSIEAASRTLKDYTPESYASFVESIVEDKIAEGQLSESDITIKELNTVKDVFKTYLAQMYHERIAYPKRK